jgi:hypothetical protein
MRLWHHGSNWAQRLSIEISSLTQLCILDAAAPQFGPPLRREVDFEADLGSHNRQN